MPDFWSLFSRLSNLHSQSSNDVEMTTLSGEVLKRIYLELTDKIRDSAKFIAILQDCTTVVRAPAAPCASSQCMLALSVPNPIRHHAHDARRYVPIATLACCRATPSRVHLKRTIQMIPTLYLTTSSFLPRHSPHTSDLRTARPHIRLWKNRGELNFPVVNGLNA
eukprot:7258825-Pyramimonas_sp.AAC.1